MKLTSEWGMAGAGAASKGGRTGRETHRLARAAPICHGGAGCQLREKQGRMLLPRTLKHTRSDCCLVTDHVPHCPALELFLVQGDSCPFTVEFGQDLG